MSQSRDDWVGAAWETLGEAGVDGVRVEALARKLGVTKGSFYWHFKNRQELIDALLERWFGLREESRQEYSLDNPNPAERLWKVIERSITRGTRGQAAALRLWAQRNDEAAAKIVEADDLRRQFFIEQFRALGLLDGEAEVRADVYMAVISAEFLHAGGRSDTDRLNLARQKHEMLVAQGEKNVTGQSIRVSASDGGEFGAYLSLPTTSPAPGIVLLHEIFGVTDWIRETADLFAAQGYCVAAPEMFWRLEPDFVADFRIPAEREKGFRYRGLIDHDLAVRDIASVIARLKSMPECSGKIGVTGFCTGATLTYLAAARLQIEAAVAYYGTQIHEFLDEGAKIGCPTILHAGTSDEHVPMDILKQIETSLADNSSVTIHEYDAGHAFAHTERSDHFSKEASELAHARTFELFGSLK
jgi:carboxymethylenebutenolidase